MNYEEKKIDKVNCDPFGWAVLFLCAVRSCSGWRHWQYYLGWMRICFGICDLFGALIYIFWMNYISDKSTNFWALSISDNRSHLIWYACGYREQAKKIEIIGSHLVFSHGFKFEVRKYTIKLPLFFSVQFARTLHFAYVKFTINKNERKWGIFRFSPIGMD